MKLINFFTELSNRISQTSNKPIYKHEKERYSTSAYKQRQKHPRLLLTTKYFSCLFTSSRLMV